MKRRAFFASLFALPAALKATPVASVVEDAVIWSPGAPLSYSITCSASIATTTWRMK